MVEESKGNFKMEIINNPKISVIIPIYNAEEFLAECIDSILNQSFSDFELLLIDDKSTDSSREICLDYAAKDRRIIFFANEENRGQAIRRNQGIREAKGEYITFIDSDDFVANDYLEKLWGASEPQKADVVSMGYLECVIDDKSGKYYASKEMNVVKDNTYVYKDKRKRIELFCQSRFIVTPWGKLYRRSFLLECNLLFEDITSEDTFFCFAVLYKADTYLLIKDSLYYYRQTPYSSMRGGNIEKFKKALESSIKVHRYINIYLKDMPEISKNDKLVRLIHKFFSINLLYTWGRNLIKGLSVNEVIEVSNDVFRENMPKDSELIGYLFEAYLMNNFKIESVKDFQ